MNFFYFYLFIYYFFFSQFLVNVENLLVKADADILPTTYNNATLWPKCGVQRIIGASKYGEQFNLNSILLNQSKRTNGYNFYK